MRNSGADPEKIARLSWGKAPETPAEVAIADSLEEGLTKVDTAAWIWIGYQKLRTRAPTAAEVFYAVPFTDLVAYLDELGIEQRQVRALFVDVFVTLEMEERTIWHERRAKMLADPKGGGETLPPATPPPTTRAMPGETRTMLGSQARGTVDK